MPYSTSRQNAIFVADVDVMDRLKINKIAIYGLALAAMLLLMKWMEYQFLILDHALDLYIGGIAILFMALGVWLAIKLSKPKKETIIIEREVPAPKVPFTPSDEAVEQRGLSARELEVLQHMASGMSNAQIADKLFVSVSTVKTHSSRIFEKLEVSRRTEAVNVARKFGIIP